MFKAKYKFNPDTLNYDKIELTLKEKLLKIFSFLFIFSSGIALISYLVFSFYFDNSNIKELKREKKELITEYKKLNTRVDHLSLILEDLQRRDATIYRALLSAEPLPTSIVEAGTGGVSSKNEFNHIKNPNLVINTSKKIDKLSHKLVIQSKSFEEIVKLANKENKKMQCIPAILPVEKKYANIVSHFGMRLHPILKIRRMHEGVDFSAPYGSNIYATGDGIVKESRYSGGYGRLITIDHGFGYTTRYAHLSKILVRRGQKIKRGDIIGKVGNTGLSTSSHLHYEVRINNKPQNPINFYFSDISPEKYSLMVKTISNQNKKNN